jgi:shikimate dehydrogenase
MQSASPPQRLFAVVGSPLGHSLSPVLHNWGFQRLGLPYVYFSWEVPVLELPALHVGLRSLPLSGASVTLPLKQAVIPYLDEATLRVRQTGAANTLYWNRDRLWGENTDVSGFLSALDHLGIAPSSALVLGAGGAACACLSGLLERGIGDVAVSARNEHAVRHLRERFKVRTVAWDQRGLCTGDLLVNATPVGMQGGPEGDASPMGDEGLTGFCRVMDLVYNPVQTPLLARARARGLQEVDGLWMFLFQGLAQFELWTGRSLDPEEARGLLENALARSH